MSDIKALGENAKLIEVILFIENTPLSIDRIISLTSLDKDDVVAGLRELDEHYKERNSGMMLLSEDDQYSFQPVTELYPKLRQSYGRKVDKRLSRAAL